MDISDKTILVIGGAGFLGSWIVEALRAKCPSQIVVPRSASYDLRSREATWELFQDVRPELVIHAAARSGGLDFHLSYPADIFHDNLQMGINILDASRRAGVEKLVLISSSCAYPGDRTGLFKEEKLLMGPLHESVAPFGLSKRALLIGAQAYRQQYGLHAVYVVLTNLYGPRDAFGPEHAHVVPALIRRFVEAKLQGVEEVVCWGTGQARRECLFVKDAAEAVLRATEVYDAPEPLNIGTGRAVAVSELAELIKEVVGFSGRIAWDPSKPEGALSKVLDVARMIQILGWQPETELPVGLKATVDWFTEHHAARGILCGS